VRATPSHPRSAPLGWDRFREIAAGASIPVYALGGVVPRDLEQARSCGAHGLAMARGAWER
jgi:8-oxo-dGTP diphosphatase